MLGFRIQVEAGNPYSGWVDGWVDGWSNVILDPTLALQIQAWIQNPSSSRVWQYYVNLTKFNEVSYVVIYDKLRFTT